MLMFLSAGAIEFCSTATCLSAGRLDKSADQRMRDISERRAFRLEQRCDEECMAVELNDPDLVVSVNTGNDQRAFLENRIVLAVDRKSTRLNSSHSSISYAVCC